MEPNEERAIEYLDEMCEQTAEWEKDPRNQELLNSERERIAHVIASVIAKLVMRYPSVLLATDNLVSLSKVLYGYGCYVGSTYTQTEVPSAFKDALKPEEKP